MEDFHHPRQFLCYLFQLYLLYHRRNLCSHVYSHKFILFVFQPWMNRISWIWLLLTGFVNLCVLFNMSVICFFLLLSSVPLCNYCTICIYTPIQQCKDSGVRYRKKQTVYFTILSQHLIQNISVPQDACVWEWFLIYQANNFFHGHQLGVL